MVGACSDLISFWLRLQKGILTLKNLGLYWGEEVSVVYWGQSRAVTDLSAAWC